VDIENTFKFKLNSYYDMAEEEDQRFGVLASKYDVNL
jgi:hypothetical protein